MALMPRVPEDRTIPERLGELVSLVAEENRKNGGRYSLAYYRGKWIELEYWNGTAQEIILPMDTRITPEALAQAFRAVEERKEEHEHSTDISLG